MVTVSFDGYTYGRSEEAKFVRVTKSILLMQLDPNRTNPTRAKPTRADPTQIYPT